MDDILVAIVVGLYLVWSIRTGIGFVDERFTFLKSIPSRWPTILIGAVFGMGFGVLLLALLVIKFMFGVLPRWLNWR